MLLGFSDILQSSNVGQNSESILAGLALGHIWNRARWASVINGEGVGFSQFYA